MVITGFGDNDVLVTIMNLRFFFFGQASTLGL